MFFFNKNLKSYFAVLIAVSCVSGCATIKNQVGDTTDLRSPGVGYVFGSVVSRNVFHDPEQKLAIKADVRAGFHSMANPGSPAFVIAGNSTGDPKDNIAEQDTFRRIVLLPAKPGKYKMGSVSATLLNKATERQMIDSPEIEVREGQITYVGSIKFTSVVGSGWLFGQPVPVSSSTLVTDDYETDASSLKLLDNRVGGFVISNGVDGKYQKSH